MCKAQALRKAYFDLLRGIDQCVILSSKYGIDNGKNKISAES